MSSPAYSPCADGAVRTRRNADKVRAEEDNYLSEEDLRNRLFRRKIRLSAQSLCLWAKNLCP